MLVTQIALSPNKLAIPPHSSTLYTDAKRPELRYQLGKKTIQSEEGMKTSKSVLGKEDLVYFKLSGYSERCAILMNDTEDLIWELSLGSPSEETIGWVDLP